MTRGWRPGIDLLLVTAAFPPERSSVSEICWELVSHLVASGRTVTVLAPASSAAQHAALPPGLSVQRSGSVGLGPLRYLRAALTLGRIARARRPRSILVATQVGARIVGSMWSVSRPLQLLVVGSEFRANLEDANGLRRWLKMRSYRMAGGFIAISAYTKSCLVAAGVPPERIAVCYLGLNSLTWGVAPKGPPEALRRLALPPFSTLILSVCRLDPRKGLDVLLGAMPEVISRVPEAVCVIAGTGPDESRLRAIAVDRGVDDRVHFVGYVSDDDKIALYDACDVFVQPSREEGRWVEGFGLTFLEAAARGKPAIGGRHGAVPEVVVDGETGSVVDPHDSGAVADAVVRILASPSLAARLGEAARRRVFAEFTWERRIPAFVKALGLDRCAS